MKRVLIISPYFPPVNAADMQRVRMSIPYFQNFGWEAEVVAIDPVHTDLAADPLLTEALPRNLVVHWIKPIPKKWTAQVGLGSIALRSLPAYRRTVNRLLRQRRFDLVYFSTTQFPVCILGQEWKRRFGVPYIIDMQDPWLSDYYEGKPKHERPPKYWFSRRIDKLLEPVAMNGVDGLLAVSKAYLQTLAERYPRCAGLPQAVIPFGGYNEDFRVAAQHRDSNPSLLPTNDNINLVYIGRGGADMQRAVRILLKGFAGLLQASPETFGRYRFWFFGTSYAAKGEGTPTLAPVAAELGLSAYVTEVTDRTLFYQTLNTLQAADGLVVPGSDDPQYTASKIYPYVLAKKPLLAIFHPASSVVSFLRSANAGTVVTFDQSETEITTGVQEFLRSLEQPVPARSANEAVIKAHSARAMTERQCALFDQVVEKKKATAGSTKKHRL